MSLYDQSDQEEWQIPQMRLVDPEQVKRSLDQTADEVVGQMKGEEYGE